MNHRPTLSPVRMFLALCTAMILFTACDKTSQPIFAEGPRRIIVISLDTLGAKHLECYGYERVTAPTITSVAADGVLFSHATAPSNWTLPSHASLFTGLYPARHGMRMKDHELGEGPVALVDRLRDSGFTTAAFTGGAYLLPRHGLDRGFDHYECEEQWDQSWDDTLAKAQEWLSGRRNEDFFLFLHTYEIHAPYTAPPNFVRRFVKHRTSFRGLIVQLQEMKKKESLRPRDIQVVVDHYDAGIAYTDDLLGGFLDWLIAEGLDENLLLVISSDHGEEFWEHGNHSHGGDMLGREVTRVPLIVRLPDGTSAGEIVDGEVSFMDIMPTVLDAVGALRPDDLDGFSLMPELAGWRIAEVDRHARERRQLHEDDTDLGVGLCEGEHYMAAESRDWKAVVPRVGIDAPAHELWPALFDLKSDADELRPMPLEGTDAEMLHLAVDRLTGEDVGQRHQAPEAAEMDEETRRQLEALGY